MPAAIRVGDPGSHGGSVASGASKVNIAGVPAARVRDSFSGDSHGPQTIATGSSKVFIEGQAAARAGDTLGCGATLASTQSKVFIG